MGVWSQKQSMEMKALERTQVMEEVYSEQIQLAAASSTIYRGNAAFVQHEGQPPALISVVNEDSVQAALDEVNGLEAGKTCILNFASYKNPGGKFLQGSSAQEEMLCHESFLYNVLEKFDKTYYAPHRAKGATNMALYYDEAIYSPNILFEHNGISFAADVLTCAAPNFAAAARYYGVTSSVNAIVLKQRIKFIKDIMETEQVQTAILGAFGCGVFGQDASLVAQYMNDIFKESHIKTIIYAVPAYLNGTNYTKFKNRIEERVN